jgi:hypothetical protein
MTVPCPGTTAMTLFLKLFMMFLATGCQPRFSSRLIVRHL